MVTDPPFLGVPVLMPGFDPLDGDVVFDDADGLEEQPARTLAPPAPNMTRPPVAAPRDRNDRRLNSLPDVTEFPHLSPACC